MAGEEAKSNRNTNKSDELISGISVIGFSRTDSGLGQVARGYARVLAHLDLDVSQRDISSELQASLDYVGLANNPVNLIVAVPNPDDVKKSMDSVGVETFIKAYNIGSWWWELSDAPPASWHTYADLYKEVWAGSTFTQKLFSEHFSLPVKLVPPIVELTSNKVSLPESCEIADDEFVFFFMCDFRSIPQRKNPKACIEAFRKAFQSAANAKLIIKVSNTKANRKYWEEMLELSKGLNIVLIEASLSRLELESLFHRCDCYISLHRSEGFGLTIAEAMLAGKPVIATGYSGNMDFMNEENSFVVPYTMVDVPDNARPYRRGSKWAEPDVEVAARYMREIYNEPQKASVKASLGSKTIQKLYSKERVAELANEALKDARAWLEQKDLMRATERLQRPAASVIEVAETVKVSVCLPVCNGEEYLQASIESVLNQTFEDFELIITDDASIDSSYSIASSFAEKDSRIRLSRNSERRGLFKNYNDCMARAQGKYIKPFAQDDLLDRSNLRIAVQVMERHPSLSLFSSRRHFIDLQGQIYEEDCPPETFFPKIAEDSVVTGDSAIAQCLIPIVNRIGEPCSVMFPKRLMGSGFDESLHHLGDIDLWFQLLQKGTYYHSRENLSSYRVHAHRATTVNTQSIIWAIDALKLGKKLAPFFQRNNLSADDYMAKEVRHMTHWAKRLTHADWYLGQLAIQKSPVPVNPDDIKELLWTVLRLSDIAGTPGLGDRSVKERTLANQVRVLEHKISELQVEVAHHEGLKTGYLSDVSARIALLEKEVKDLMGSQSWKFTESLRQMSRVSERNARATRNARIARDVEHSPILIEPPLRSEEEVMHDYLVHLAALKVSIQKSRSWQLTAPFRSIGIFRD